MEYINRKGDTGITSDGRVKHYKVEKITFSTVERNKINRGEFTHKDPDSPEPYRCYLELDRRIESKY